MRTESLVENFYMRLHISADLTLLESSPSATTFVHKIQLLLQNKQRQISYLIENGLNVSMYIIQAYSS